MYYRLNVIHIEVPPLRDRKDDIPLLISSFLEEFNNENGKHIKSVDSRAKAAMFKYGWPGNIRELRNCMESAVVMCGGDEITLEDLPPTVRESGTADSISVPLGVTLDEAEKIIIQENLAANRNNRSRTAEVLGIGRKTLQRRLSEWGMEDDGEK